MTLGAASSCWGVGRVEDMVHWWSRRIMWFRGGEGHVTAFVGVEDKKSGIKMADGWIVDFEL